MIKPLKIANKNRFEKPSKMVYNICGRIQINFSGLGCLWDPDRAGRRTDKSRTKHKSINQRKEQIYGSVEGL
jgi:hypothetical protein